MNNVERLDKVREMVGLPRNGANFFRRAEVEVIVPILCPELTPLELATTGSDKLMKALPGYQHQCAPTHPTVSNSRNILSKLEKIMLGPKPSPSTEATKENPRTQHHRERPFHAPMNPSLVKAIERSENNAKSSLTFNSALQGLKDVGVLDRLSTMSIDHRGTVFIKFN